MMETPRTGRCGPAGEDELIDWLKRLTARRGSCWIGDDAAVLPAAGEWAVTMDSQVEGVHFTAGLDPAIVARRLLAVNLSDLAAMGALPSFAFLALSAPGGFDHRRFLEALAAACADHNLHLAGGDLSRNRQLTAVLTLLGEKPHGQRWLRRGEARAGEQLWLGGAVGEAAAGAALLGRGATLERRSLRLPSDFDLPPEVLEVARRAVLRQLAPRAQLELGSWLGAQAAGAAIDVSDGLARDLHRLCDQSGVGAEIDLDLLPISEGLRPLAGAIDRDWRELALAGGEDYVLLFTLPADCEPPRHFGCARIGTIVRPGTFDLVEEGRRRPLPPSGWDHLSVPE